MQDADEWPTGALAHVEEQGLRGKFFTPPDYGSYLTWRLGTKVQTYTDTRGFFFPPALLEDSHFIPQLAFDWRERLNRVLDEFQTDYFLLETTGPRGDLWRSLKEYVDRPLYLDQQTVLLSADQVRRGLEHLDRRLLTRAK